MMIIRFLIYGIIGWCLEIFWTGMHSFLRKDYKLTAFTSLWMFPIYGSVVFFEPFVEPFLPMPFIVRGVFYMALIFMVEYITGFGLKMLTGACPWDYSGEVYSIQGFIRLDYAPVWFFAGLIFEQIYGLLNIIM